jgi:hypothetical protein
VPEDAVPLNSTSGSTVFPNVPPTLLQIKLSSAQHSLSQRQSQSFSRSVTLNRMNLVVDNSSLPADVNLTLWNVELPANQLPNPSSASRSDWHSWMTSVCQQLIDSTVTDTPSGDDSATSPSGDDTVVVACAALVTPYASADGIQESDMFKKVLHFGLWKANRQCWQSIDTSDQVQSHIVTWWTMNGKQWWHDMETVDGQLSTTDVDYLAK